MPFRSNVLLIAVSLLLFSSCRSSSAEVEIRYDVKYLAAFSSPALVTADDEKRLTTGFQSKYKSRVVLLRPVTGQATLVLADTKISLFAVIKVGALREARGIAKEIADAMGAGALTALFPFIETPGSQDNFSGSIFYLGLEKRGHAFTRLTGQSKIDTYKTETEDFSKDRNILSYFSASMLSDTPYHSIHILGFSGLAESQYETLDGVYHRTVKKLDAADTVLLEKVR